ncbi:MAG: ATP-dependent DNA helicase [Phycisphaerae bacterium]
MTAIEILEKGGLIAQKLSEYEVRPEQLDMAGAVEEAFAQEEHLLVEAGTGVGKSFAYLIPAINLAVEKNEPVVVSTHTIALQEQLFHKDIPFLQSVLPMEFSAVLVKGRANYVGLRRLARASGRQDLLFDGLGQLSELHRIEDWAYKTEDGSLSDLPSQPAPVVWDRVRSDADDCLGRRCPYFDKCFYQRARKKAQAAQLLVVNHAMLFSDLAVRRQGASILPDYRYVVLDEAHTVEQVAGDHLGLSVTNTQVRYLLNALHNERTGKGMLGKRLGQDLVPLVRSLHEETEGHFEALADWHDESGVFGRRLRQPPPVENISSTRLVELRDALRALRGDADDETRLEIEGQMQRCRELTRAIDYWHKQAVEDSVYWLDVSRGRRLRVELNVRPIEVGPVLQAALFEPVASAVLTSATLTTGGRGDFDFMRRRVGLEDVRCASLGSPFDYQRQLEVYVEATMPNPAQSGAFTEAAIGAIRKYVAKTDGRAFVLFTSYQMLKVCAESLASFLEQQGMALLVQGAGLGRSQMLDRFRAEPRSVLFGTDTFWAGVDVPGEALSNVIITKLPFSVPTQPIVEARAERIKEAGGNPFMELHVPEAILKLKQGVGRLIRTRRDSGIVVILDPRVVSKPYGKHFLAALPDCPVHLVRNV